MSLKSGTRLGRYEIKSLIGAGGMGEVYLAQDRKLDRQVALKILPPALAFDQERMRRFVQEAKAASALNHPNIITIHEIDQADSGYFIAMEFIDGHTLREHMRNAPMNLSEVLDVAAQVASALVAAHAAEIVHRDIKPENIMLRRDRLVKVLDFGLAKLTVNTSATVDTQAVTRFKTDSGKVVGTAIYMSPEQARGLEVDARTDIFSLGVVVYEMVAGRLPFAGSTSGEVLASILSDKEPQPLARYAREVPAELERIVSKALRKDRDQRYQTVKDLMLDLQSLKRQRAFESKLEHSQPLESQIAPPTASQPSAVDLMTKPSGGSTSSIERLTSSPKLRRRNIILAAAVLALLAAVLAYAFLFRRAPVTAQPEIRSLAVLPLTNLSGDASQDYFADGMTEEIITELSKIGALRVTSRTSIMQYKGTRKTMPEIARELNVDALVEGSVLRSGERIRITVQLIHAPTDKHLWADSYERDVRDILSLQSEVGRAIADEIKIKLTPQEQRLLTNARPVNPEALEVYLKGRDYLNQGRNKYPPEGPELLKKSVAHFEQAIRIQPDYALAYAGLARADSFLDNYSKSKEEALKALQIDETLAEAHGALAYALMFYDWDLTGSEREYKRAIELNPSYAEAHWLYALYLSALGRHAEAIREINVAEELDPLTLSSLKTSEGHMYIYARQYDRAIELFRQLIDKEPNFVGGHRGLGRAYILEGKFDEGIAELHKGVELSGDDPSKSVRLAWGYAASGQRGEAIKTLDAVLKSLSNGELLTSGVPASKEDIASTYAALGDKDQAFAWLNKAYDEHSPELLGLKVDPAYDSLRSDPRFADLMRRVGLPQ